MAKSADEYRKMSLDYATGEAERRLIKDGLMKARHCESGYSKRAKKHKHKQRREKKRCVLPEGMPPARDFAKRFAAESKRTKSEAMMAHLMRENLNDVQWHEQVPIHRWIADFYVPSKRLLIEVDGEYHFFRGKEDAARTKSLRKRGYDVVRFTNFEVCETPWLVVNELRRLCIGSHAVLHDS